MLRNTEIEYGSVAKFLHWSIALFILLMLIMGFTAILLPSDTYGWLRSDLITVHKSLGLTILLLMIIRLVWKFTNDRPQLPSSVLIWEKALARIAHFSLYLLIFAMILIGWTMSAAGGYQTKFWGLIDMSLPIAKNHNLELLGGQLHLIFAWVLLGFIVFHILGALKHYFYDKDQVLQRMLPFQLSSQNKS